MAFRITPDGEVTKMMPAGKTWTLDELHAVIGGWVEVVRHGARFDKDSIMVVDEEGLIKQKPYNADASQLAGQPIVGTVLYGYATELDI